MANIIEVPGMGLVEFPDGMTDDQITAAIKLNAPKQASAGRTAAMGAQGATDAILNTVGAPVDAANWLLKRVGAGSETPFGGSDSLKQGADYLKNAFGSLLPGSLQPSGSRLTPETRPEKIAAGVGEGVGSALGMLGGVGALRAGATLGPVASGVMDTLASAPAMQVASGATGGAVSGATDSPLLGLGASMLVPAAAQGALRTVSAAPAVGAEAERRALVETARQNNIPISAGKITGSTPLQTMESVIGSLPVVGAPRQAFEARTREAFNRAALRTGGEDMPAATPNTMEAAFDRVGRVFNNLTQGHEVQISPQFATTMQGIRNEYGDKLLSQIRPGIMRQIDELSTAGAAANQPGQNVILNGTTYQRIRSDLSKLSGEHQDGDVRRAARQMVNALDNEAEQSLPRDVMDDWRRARREWRNLSTIDEAVRARNNPETALGNIPPAALASRSQDNPDLRNISRVGTAFVGDKVPNSGTPSRLGWMGAFGAPGAAVAGDPTQAALYAAAGMGVPLAADLMINNPATRALLMARYRNPTEGVPAGGLVASLLAQHAAQGRNP